LPPKIRLEKIRLEKSYPWLRTGAPSGRAMFILHTHHHSHRVVDASLPLPPKIAAVSAKIAADAAKIAADAAKIAADAAKIAADAAKIAAVAAKSLPFPPNRCRCHQDRLVTVL
jgi:hypothetical protein